MAQLGRTTVGTLTDTASAGVKEVFKVTPTEDGYITQASGYLSGLGQPSGSQLIKVVVFADSAGVPGAYKGESRELSIPAGSGWSWRNFDFDVPVAKTNGVPIWIGYHAHSVSDLIQLKAFSAPPGVKFNVDDYFDGTSNPFGAASTASTVGDYSLYVTYTPAAAPLPPPASPFFKGIAGGYILDRSDAQIAREISEIKAAGAQVYRFDLNPLIWGRTQAVINMCTAAGMPVMSVYTHGKTNPTIANDVALMYAWLRDNGVRMHEFHNEPNGPWGSWGTPDAAGYVAGLHIWAPLVRAIDPSAILLCGVLSPAADNATDVSPDTFFQQMLTAGLLRADFDGVSVHAYDDVDLTSAFSIWRKTWGSTPSIRQKMDALGWTTVPIYSTEGGAPNTDPNVATIIRNNLNFFKRTDKGPLGCSLIYSAESPDQFPLWPGGVPNAGATAFANVSIPRPGVVNADLVANYNIIQQVRRDIIAHYNVSAPTGLSVVGAQFSANYNIRGRVSGTMQAVYNIAGVTPFTDFSESEAISFVRQPTDLDSFAQRLYDLIGDIAGGYR